MKIFFQSGIDLKLFKTKGINHRKLSTGRDCFFPKNNWNPVTLDTEKNIDKQELTNPYVLFFSISDQMRLNFLDEVFPLIQEGTSPELLRSFALKTLKNCTLVDFKEFRSVDLSLTPPYQESTAYNYQINEYLGLHIDTHDGISNTQRSNAWSLIAINFGTTNRYLNFVDLSFNAICEKLRNKKGMLVNWEEVRMPELVSHFFTQFPNHPIFRAEIPPSHGYIACTQNFVHDGATNSIGEDDINMLISGNFKIINLDLIKSIML